MERLFRKLSIACFVVAALSLLMHLSGIALRIMLDIRQVYVVDVLLDAQKASFLKGTDALIYHLLRTTIIYGTISQVMFVLAQLFIQIHDVVYVKKWMEITAETQIKLLKENEKDLIGLVDRVVPLIALFVFSFILVGEWVKTSMFMAEAELTQRIVLLPNLTLTVVGWAAAFFASLLISLVFLWYFRSRMLAIYHNVKAD